MPPVFVAHVQGKKRVLYKWGLKILQTQLLPDSPLPPPPHPLSPPPPRNSPTHHSLTPHPTANSPVPVTVFSVHAATSHQRWNITSTGITTLPPSEHVFHWLCCQIGLGHDSTSFSLFHQALTGPEEVFGKISFIYRKKGQYICLQS